ncbi:integrase [Gossypium australe]|uniref:Integrase n=1 Tax=Gossypium australe TaxID=47621 RepID=A0A5B6X2H3_9ROSI|nr:integrase [Gossypium australe]
MHMLPNSLSRTRQIILLTTWILQLFFLPIKREGKWELIKNEQTSEFSIGSDESLCCQNLCDASKWKQNPGMKREITKYIANCLVCEQVKVRYQVPSSLLQPIMNPQWKWK